MGFEMAARRRHWKEKDGRFWARIAIPATLRSYFGGKTQLAEALGGDRRQADRIHPAAVARLQEQIEKARRMQQRLPTTTALGPVKRPISAEYIKSAIWEHHLSLLAGDELKRAQMPTFEDMTAEYERIWSKIDSGEIGIGVDAIGVINSQTEYELMLGAAGFYQRLNSKRLAALKSALSVGDPRFVAQIASDYIEKHQLSVAPGSVEWRELTNGFMRAEIAALERMLERDEGNFAGSVADPLIQPPAPSEAPVAPVPIMSLFEEYIASRQAIGKHKDDGRNWTYPVKHLIGFLQHDDARKVTRRNLLDWRDALIASGMSPKTVADKYLAAVRAVLRWAHENERLPTNEAATVKQQTPRKVSTRERGYTTAEAVKILKATIGYEPAQVANPANRESAHIAAAKRWVPLLCAFTGARVTELTQLRKQDFRVEDGRWVLRITPEAGSVKTGQYRDVPLHRQVVELGFIDFLKGADPGPLFHRAKSVERYHAAASGISGKISQWLQSLGLVPDEVQPLYGWRHRFKTLGFELGAPGRVLDAIQGHPGKTASDRYGDVTNAAKLRLIDSMPDYDLSGSIGVEQ